MQFGVYINQVKALEWGLNFQQAGLFAVVYEAQHWADSIVVAGRTYYNLSKNKIIDELPLLTDKKDTVYRLLKQLEEKGVIVCTRISGKDYFLITDRGRGWNREPNLPPQAKTPDQPAANECEGEPFVQLPLACGHDSEKNPSHEKLAEKAVENQSENISKIGNSEKNPNDGENSEERIKIRQTSENIPESPGKKSDELYNQDNNYQDQSQRQQQRVRARDEEFQMHWEWEPQCNFGERLQLAGIVPGQIHHGTFIQILADFISYWSGEGVACRASKWDHKLLQFCISKFRKGELYAPATACQMPSAKPGHINWDSTDWINGLDLSRDP